MENLNNNRAAAHDYFQYQLIFFLSNRFIYKMLENSYKISIMIS